jgi:hypothetical protein
MIWAKRRRALSGALGRGILAETLQGPKIGPKLMIENGVEHAVFGKPMGKTRLYGADIPKRNRFSFRSLLTMVALAIVLVGCEGRNRHWKQKGPLRPLQQ